MNRSFFAIVMAIIFSLIPALGQAEKETAWDVSGKIDILSGYVLDMGISGTARDEPVAQAALTFTHKPTGVWLSPWVSQVITNPDDEGSYGNEIDYGIGWSRQIRKGLLLGVSVQYYDLVGLFEFNDDLVDFGLDLRGENLYLELDYLVETGKNSPSDGWTIVVGYQSTTSTRIPVWWDVSFVHNEGTGSLYGDFLHLEGAPNWKIGDYVLKAPLVKMSVPVRGNYDYEWAIGVGLYF